MAQRVQIRIELDDYIDDSPTSTYNNRKHQLEPQSATAINKTDVFQIKCSKEQKYRICRGFNKQIKQVDTTSRYNDKIRKYSNRYNIGEINNN